MPAMDTILLKQQLLDGMQNETWWPAVTGEIVEAARRQASREDKLDAISGDNIDAAVAWSVTRTITMSENFYVSPDMQVLVTAAAEVTDDEEPVRREDFPCEVGFLLIPGGLVYLTVTGEPMLVSAVTWNLYGSAVHLTQIVDTTHPVAAGMFRVWMERDQIDPTLMGRYPRLTPVAYYSQQLGQPVAKLPMIGDIIPPEISRQITLEIDDNEHTVAVLPVGWTPEHLVPRNMPDPLTRWLVACLRLMRQELTSVREHGLPANLRKALRRHPVKMRNTHVTVIEYRRRAAWHGPEGSGREFSHRFFRRGHMRRQPHKNPDGTWGYHLVYIHPTIVGDPSKPLLLREHVNALMR